MMQWVNFIFWLLLCGALIFFGLLGVWLNQVGGLLLLFLAIPTAAAVQAFAPGQKSIR